jgi:hypothetical protein
MSPEAMYDSLLAATGQQKLPGGLGSPIPFEIYAEKARGRPPRADAEFIGFFGAGDASAPATNSSQGIPQILALMNAAQDNRTMPIVEELVKAKTPRDEAIEKLFLAALARRPTHEESERIARYLDNRDDAAAAYSGVLWILLNSSEFVLNH